MQANNQTEYYYKPSTDKDRAYELDLYFSQFESEPEPRYTIRHPDPSWQTAKNCYAAALFDAYLSEVLYGEVLVKPQWTQATLSQEEIRKNGGIPSPPQPVIPLDFTVQLYNPDQQITVVEKPGSWAGQPSYTFSMPQYTFRTPSVSALDRQHSDPAADNTTPKINFVWRHEKLSKDLTCFLIGKSTDTQSKKKGGKEPGITVALFSAYRNLTIYEPNLHRVEMEDYKGLEIVLLLSATVIRDIYCGQMKDCFNVGEAPLKNSSGLMRRKSSPLLKLSPGSAAAAGSSQTPPRRPSIGKSAALNGLYGRPVEARRNTTSSAQRPAAPLPPDPRTQWEIEAETARLRAQEGAERRAEEQRRREREKADEAEARRIKKMLEAEEKERRKKQAEIDKETERLRKQYGDQSALMPPPKPPLPERNSAPGFFQGGGLPGWFGGSSTQQQQQQPPPPSLVPPPVPPNRPVYAPQYPQQHYQNAAASHSSFFHGPSSQQPPGVRPKRSFWGLGGLNEVDGQRLQRKRSSEF